MKKIIVVLGVICAAVLAQAASIDWSLTATKSNKVYGADGSTVFGKTSGDVAYLVLESNLANIKSASDVAGLAVGSADSFNSYGGIATRTATSSSLSENTKYNFAVVLVQGDQFLVTPTIAGTTSDADTVREAVFTYADVKASTGGWGKGSGGGEDVPEPTSGLLLLVGGAMLALRRKQK